MGHSLEAPQPSEQDLSSPGGPVASVASPVVDGAHRKTLFPVLRQAGGEVGVVVLHAEGPEVRAIQRVLGGQVLRVEIVRHHLRR